MWDNYFDAVLAGGRATDLQVMLSGHAAPVMGTLIKPEPQIPGMYGLRAMVKGGNPSAPKDMLVDFRFLSSQVVLVVAETRAEDMPSIVMPRRSGLVVPQ